MVADDHPVVRGGLRALLGSIDGFEVAGEAEDGHGAVREAVEHGPDVLVMDVRMPGLDGIEATRRIGRVAPGVAVLMLTMYEDDDSVFEAMRAGARGYLLKGAQQDDIARAIRAVAAGEAIFGPGVARRVLGYFAAPPSAAEPFPELTARERQVLDLIAAGRANAEIARALAIAPKTVANHISAIFTKLRVADRSAAIVRARRAGFGLGGGPRGPRGTVRDVPDRDADTGM
ncbi:LuxR family two component transcriptional regulator [Actinomadura verrucosospora]|uniref:LuxR family two component transcriptional regulator n=1 Tax=Actinomadura verrucosospora TaxID=46165 RepID=A0A7D4A9U9_ACTVE|nr:LuxR family two component transcriptional regulator [Actinomadura verrucosospora]